jgi:hypothetical protein
MSSVSFLLSPDTSEKDGAGSLVPKIACAPVGTRLQTRRAAVIRADLAIACLKFLDRFLAFISEPPLAEIYEALKKARLPVLPADRAEPGAHP